MSEPMLSHTSHKPEMPPPKGILHGAGWMVALRFGIRAIGMLSTIILARLLTPADFGLIAMAMLVVSALDLFAQSGQRLALIRNPNPDRSHYDTAWTITVVIGIGQTAALLALAPFASEYFNDERVGGVIAILSLKSLFAGFENIGTVDFRRELNFSREFKYGVIRKIATFCTTMAAVYWWRDFHALAIGIVVGQLCELAASYIMHPYRPRPNLSRWGEYWGFSLGVFFVSLANFIQHRIDQVVVAGTTTSQQMGLYTVGSELGVLAATEVLEPVSRSLFPNYSKMINEPDLFKAAFLTVVTMAGSVAISGSVGIFLVAEDLVEVLLGEQWGDAVPILRWFTAVAVVAALCDLTHVVLFATGDSKKVARLTWLRVSLFLPAMYIASQTGRLEDFAIARFAVTILLAPTYFYQLRTRIDLTVIDLGCAIYRPATAGAAMVGIVMFVQNATPDGFAIVRLLVAMIIGSISFIIVQVGLWKLAGAPDGFEAQLLKALKQRLSIA